jgi:hypothetical protein
LNSLSEDPQEIADLAQAMEQMSTAMGEAERDKMMNEGRAMSLDEAVELVLTYTMNEGRAMSLDEAVELVLTYTGHLTS